MRPVPNSAADPAFSSDGRLVLVAEFRDRRFDTTLPQTSFELPISPATRPVQYFVLPPADGSAELLGRVRQGFWFTDLYGDKKYDRDWDGQIVVMVWFGNHPASRAVLQEVQQAADRYASDDRLQFLAICVEPSTSLSHRRVDELLRSWSIRLPAVRDFDAFGRDVFRVDQAPTLVVLDQQQRVQLVEIGEARVWTSSFQWSWTGWWLAKIWPNATWTTCGSSVKRTSGCWAKPAWMPARSVASRAISRFSERRVRVFQRDSTLSPLSQAYVFSVHARVCYLSQDWERSPR